MRIRVVFFDVGETLVDESRIRRVWAGWLGVPISDLDHALRDTIRRREHHRTLFQRLRPGFDIDAARKAGGAADQSKISDLYPDAMPCLRALRRIGCLVGIAGNQRKESEHIWKGLPVDLLGSSERWGAEKPAPAFFKRLIAECGCAPAEIAYVGDRLDNDILPAQEAGMLGVFLRRGPWAAIQAEWPQAAEAHIQIDTLLELPGKIAALP